MTLTMRKDEFNRLKDPRKACFNVDNKLQPNLQSQEIGGGLRWNKNSFSTRKKKLDQIFSIFDLFLKVDLNERPFCINREIIQFLKLASVAVQIKKFDEISQKQTFLPRKNALELKRWHLAGLASPKN